MRQRGQHADAKIGGYGACSVAADRAPARPGAAVLGVPMLGVIVPRVAMCCALCLTLGAAFGLPAFAHTTAHAAPVHTASPQHSPPPHYTPAPRPSAPPPGNPGSQGHPNDQGNPGNPGNHAPDQYRGEYSRGEAQRQNHLGDWLQKHQNMSSYDQEKALRREPGFNQLPADQQQRLVERLQKLNSQPPEQRQRTLSRMEAMERLSPPQREEVRQSAQQLSMLPPDRQRMVRKAFRDLRDMPGQQRDAVLNSPRFQSEFSGDERHVLGTLLQVEPYQGGAPPGAVPAPR